MKSLLTIAACAALLPVLSGCSNSAERREDALAANEARIDQRMAEIRAEYETRIRTARTDDEKRAVIDWQRAAYTEALNEYNAEGLRIFREVR